MLTDLPAPAAAYPTDHWDWGPVFCIAGLWACTPIQAHRCNGSPVTGRSNLPNYSWGAPVTSCPTACPVVSSAPPFRRKQVIKLEAQEEGCGGEGRPAGRIAVTTNHNSKKMRECYNFRSGRIFWGSRNLCRKFLTGIIIEAKEK